MRSRLAPWLGLLAVAWHGWRWVVWQSASVMAAFDPWARQAWDDWYDGSGSLLDAIAGGR